MAGRLRSRRMDQDARPCLDVRCRYRGAGARRAHNLAAAGVVPGFAASAAHRGRGGDQIWRIRSRRRGRGDAAAIRRAAALRGLDFVQHPQRLSVPPPFLTPHRCDPPAAIGPISWLGGTVLDLRLRMRGDIIHASSISDSNRGRLGIDGLARADRALKGVVDRIVKQMTRTKPMR